MISGNVIVMHDAFVDRGPHIEIFYNLFDTNMAALQEKLKYMSIYNASNTSISNVLI